jgi:tetratricopeptide (TPR) repeat protein
MAVQSERLSNRPFFSRKRRGPYARSSHFGPGLRSRMREEHPFKPSVLARVLNKVSLPFGILLVLLCLSLWLLSGYVLGKIRPEYMVTVQPFEISPEIGNRTSLSGKSASDIVVDILNDAASHAAQFHGTDYYSYGGEVKPQPVCLHHAIKVPIQTSYGIELKGISVDSVMHLYDKARYEQWIIGGDVVSSPGGLVGRIRLNNADAAKSWETPPSAHANASELVRDATYLMLAREAPELLGQNYLQQANYKAAEEVFRQWAIDDPQNWKPSYYLSLVYSYQGKLEEASSLANWSNNLASGETSSSSKKHRAISASDREIAFNLSQATKIALQVRGTSDPQALDTLQHTLATLGQGQSVLTRLFISTPANADYRIQRARVLDKEALIELDRNSPAAYEHSRQAIDSLDEAIRSVPENGGLYEQRADLLMHLVAIMKKQGKGSHEIRAKGIEEEIKESEIEEAKENTRALELRPKDASATALWGAVYGQIRLGNSEAAVDLARTITLLRPDCTAVNAAYIVALEGAIKSSGDEPEREKEVDDRLGKLLTSNPEKSELLAVLDAFLKKKDRDRADVVAAEGERRFPEDRAFEERKIQSYFVGSLHDERQTGSGRSQRL